MNRNIIETLMGAIVLTVAGFFVIFAYKSSGFEQHTGTLYKAQFDRADGLVVGSDVRISGVKVGSVSSLIINPKTYLAEATFVVNASVALPQDSSAAIISSGLLGDKYLSLIPGGDDENLKAGDTLQHTQSSVNLESMIGQFIFSSKDKDDKSDKGPSK